MSSITFNIITIFPNLFDNIFSYGVISKAIEKEIININIVDLRKFALDKHRVTEDYSYGGGPGLVMKVEPIYNAVKYINEKVKSNVILLDPRGKKFDDNSAKKLANCKAITFICGRYEGVDERIRKLLVDETYSIGDFILSGGEFAAATMIDAISRYVKGVLGDENSVKEESFTIGGLEYPQYTRPYEFKNEKVPKVLIGGNHAEIDRWRKREAFLNTLKNRRDLLKSEFLKSGNFFEGVKDEFLTYVTKHLSIALMHYPMKDKKNNVVVTAITNIDLHDISRTCKTYNVNKFYLINPVKSQRDIARRVLKHWINGFGSCYNSNRKEAFEQLEVRESLLEVIKEIKEEKGSDPILVATTAKKRDNIVEKFIDIDKFFDILINRDVLLLFGTGWGFTDDFLKSVDYILEPIEGLASFNHLSVRSAIAILLDRIFGGLY
ncbi:MAG: tRNA (guanosine(37)-N1)-methyltransferase TrmD [Deferribacterota bacterium]|nr:tRNA (guanosine(37)-N1)-methyltransferase TrmD [Deferribacterota bacterium]